MKKHYIVLLLLFILVLNIYGEKLVILHTNDHHGRPFGFKENEIMVGGLPARATIINQIREENKNVILLDCGDINDGLFESNLFNAAPDFLGYNYLKYDAMTLGNHEFYKSLQNLKDQQIEAKFPFLCANILNKDGSYLAEPYVIIEVSGLKIGIIGLTTTTIEYSAPIAVTNELQIIDEVKVAQQIVDLIKDKVDYIIALTHLGINKDDNYGSLRLARLVDNIDIVIDGHSHTYLEKPIFVTNEKTKKEVPVVQANCWGTHIGKAEFDISEKGLTFLNWEPISIVSTEKDDKVLHDLLSPYLKEATQLMGEIIGKSDKYYGTETVRMKENELASLCVQAMLWYYEKEKPDFSVTNGGGVRHFLNKGDVKKEDIYNVFPFDNYTVLLELRGADIINIVEKSINTKVNTGGYLHFSNNIKITLNANKSIKQIKLNNKVIEANKIYRILTNSYLANGGDSYTEFLNGKKLSISQKFDREIVVDYIKTKLNGKIKIQITPQIIKASK